MKLKTSHFFYIVLLTSLVIILYHQTLTNFWRWDDSQILLQAVKNSPFDYFFNARIWQQLTATNLTPWVTFSFDFDLFVFGDNPKFFYLHQLVSLLFCAISMYFLMSLWVNKLNSFLATLLFLVGAPVVTISNQLMTRHYLEGLIFIILSLLFFVLQERENKHKLYFLTISLFFYTLAVTAKETYVPLVILFFFLSSGNLIQRLRASSAFIGIAFLYVIWRSMMLNSMIGGYGDYTNYLSSAFVVSVIHSFSHFPELLFASWSWLFVSVYLLILIVYLFYTRSKLLISLLVLSLVLIPLIPLIERPGINSPDRYLFLFWFVLCFSTGFYINAIWQALYQQKNYPYIKLSAFILIWFILIASSTYGGLLQKSKLESLGENFDRHGRFVWDNNHTINLLPSPKLLNSFWYFTGLIEFKKLLLNQSAPYIILERFFFLEINDHPIFSYASDCQCIKEDSRLLKLIVDDNKKNTRDDAPLAISFQNNHGFLSWEFKPYKKGSYSIVSRLFGKVALSPKGYLKTNLDQDFSFYIQFTSPKGWKTYSPPLLVKPDNKVVNWSK